MTDLLSVDDLRITFNPPAGPVRAVRGVSLDVRHGEILGVAGESGCGKSVLFRALLGMVPPSATVTGSLRLDGASLGMDGSLQAVAALIQQNPGAALNPVFTIGRQLHLVARTDDPAVLADLLAQAGLADAPRLLDAYPHELSGGMLQRSVIALALARRPRLLIADEPTTALDATTQAQVLDLLGELRARHGLTVILISHDLAVIRRLCDRVVVLYAGRVAEAGATADVLDAPGHPYTQALLESIPRPAVAGRELASIPGLIPDGRRPIAGCAFAPRCPHVREDCRSGQPEPRPLHPGHTVACVLMEPPP
ncbi:MAG: ABC transporter ATP-binding protein [bacterium]|nr:ABC transporter ATP-binding protein [bacterium]